MATGENENVIRSFGERLMGYVENYKERSTTHGVELMMDAYKQAKSGKMPNAGEIDEVWTSLGNVVVVSATIRMVETKIIELEELLKRAGIPLPSEGDIFPNLLEPVDPKLSARRSSKPIREVETPEFETEEQRARREGKERIRQSLGHPERFNLTEEQRSLPIVGTGSILIRDMSFEVRVPNAYRSKGVRTLVDLLGKTEEELLEINGVGKKAIDRIVEGLYDRGIVPDELAGLQERLHAALDTTSVEPLLEGISGQRSEIDEMRDATRPDNSGGQANFISARDDEFRYLVE